MQSRYGIGKNLRYSGMLRQKHDALLSALLSVLDDNVRLLMEHKFQSINTSHKRVLELERRSGVGRSTIYRIVPSLKRKTMKKRGKETEPTYAGIDKIAVIARVLGHSAAQLLTHDYANQYLASLETSSVADVRKSNPM